MVLMKSCCCMFLVVLLFASVMESWEYRKTAEEVFLSQLIDPVTGEVNEGMAELLWINCRLDFINLREDKDLSFFFQDEKSSVGGESNRDDRSQAKEHIWKIIQIQHSKLKQTLIDCTRKNSLLLPVSGESESSDLKPAVLKRNLLQNTFESPPPIGSPFISPAPSPNLSPPPHSSANPAPPFFPLSGGDGSPTPSPPPRKFASHVTDSDSKHKEIVTAVVVTAVVSFGLALLLFFCCTKYCRKGSRQRKNDESPLLSLSISDSSTGSTYTSYGFVNNVKEDSLRNGSGHEKDEYSLDGIKSGWSSLGAIAATATYNPGSNDKPNTIGRLPPPPGRVLKPPPGRATPLPPEPPASLRAPSKARPPPPPTLSIPPPPSKASGGAVPHPPGPPPPPPPLMAPGTRHPPPAPAPPSMKRDQTHVVFDAKPSSHRIPLDAEPHPLSVDPSTEPGPMSHQLSATPSARQGPPPPPPPHMAPIAKPVSFPPPPAVTHDAKPRPAPPPPPAIGAAKPNPPPPPPPQAAASKTGPPPPPPSIASAAKLDAPSPLPQVAPTGKQSPPPPPPPVAPGAKVPPPPPPIASGARPGPPPPSGGPPPPRAPPPMGSKFPRPPGSKLSASGEVNEPPKTKLKPFFWDKVLANPDHSMVWHQIKSGSFQFNEEMIETLFGYTPTDQTKNERKKESSSQEPASQFVQILDTKKAQNISILLRALNVTVEEVRDALYEGNELPAELIETVLKMTPTTDEELKLRMYTGEIEKLGPAERFLKALIDIPHAYKRLEALLFISSLQEEVTTTRESFGTLEVACEELRNSRLFLKLLEAVLKTGNRMNDGTFRGGAQAFKLDTLLKLSDVKGTDGKTTLLHFVVQEIIRSEGVRAARARKNNHSLSNVSTKTDDLIEDGSPDKEEEDYHSLGLEVVSHLSSELENVKKAAAIDADLLTGVVAKLGNSLLKTKDFLNKEMKTLDEDSEFHEMLESFVQHAEVDVTALLEEEKRIMALVKSTGDYFHGKAGKDEGLRLFSIVRDFLIILDKVCREVGEAQKRAKSLRKASQVSNQPSSQQQQQQPPPSDLRAKLFPAIAERQMRYSSSDDES